MAMSVFLNYVSHPEIIYIIIPVKDAENTKGFKSFFIIGTEWNRRR